MHAIDTRDALHGDRPLAGAEADRLGFSDVAAQLAASLAGPNIRGSFVLGLEGKWGSGKSSLLNLLQAELKRLRVEAPHSVVPFEPWLVGNRDALLGSLFEALLAAIGRVEAEQGDTTRETKVALERAADAARGFAKALGKFGGLVEVAGTAAAIAPISWAGKGIKALGTAIGREKTVKPLTHYKKELVSALEKLGHRFIVCIDDLDRLDPQEALEVLRLTRSVADLPGVIYVLCYDADVLARNIKQAAGVDNGHAYLEKIVQATIMVPRPEVFQLRYWLTEELKTFAGTLNEDGLDRLRTVIDMEGGLQLKTPRNVNRVLDALRLIWPVLQPQGADLPDLVWLQLIKEGTPKLYRWVEEYCAIQAEVSLGVARTDEHQHASMLQELTDNAGDQRFDNLHYRAAFAEQLAGAETNYGEGLPPLKLFGPVSEAARDKAIAGKRLKSMDHYRLYFALSQPSHALTASEVRSFWQAAESGSDEVAAALLRLHTSPTSRGIGKADLLLDRVGLISPDLLTPLAAENVLLALADILDDAYRARPFDRDWVVSLFDRAERVVPLLLGHNAERRFDTISAMFGKGRSITWLTLIYRHDIYYQGRFGNEKKPESEWLFSGSELDAISHLMTDRYRAMSFDDVLATLEPRRLLFTWSQGGDEVGVQELISSAMQDDQAFLRLLSALQSQIGTSDGRFDVLKRQTIADFMDLSLALARLTALAESSLSEVRSVASELLAKLKLGDRY